MQCQNNGNLGEMRYTRKTHMERNENLIYDYDRGTETESRDIQKYIKNDNSETVETDNQRRFFCEDKIRHAIDKINWSFKIIISKS